MTKQREREDGGSARKLLLAGDITQEVLIEAERGGVGRRRGGMITRETMCRLAGGKGRCNKMRERYEA